MIVITIPNNNLCERKYILNVIFSEFLGLEYKVEAKDIAFYEISYKENLLIIKDYFFNLFKDELSYLHQRNIPQSVKYMNNPFENGDIVVLFGDSKFTFEDKVKKEIVCSVDIFASAFFMLTRWEEFVNRCRDEHGRFPAYESCAFKNDFLGRAIVNEYVELLWRSLLHLGYQEKRMDRKFDLMLTHDVDIPFQYESFKATARLSASYLILKKDYLSAFQHLLNYFKVKFGTIDDPFDTFDYLMDVSESINKKSYFFFMAKGHSKHDAKYSIFSKKTNELIKEIQARGHYVGLHSSYDSSIDVSSFANDKREVENAIEQAALFGRGHFLRFEIPYTWQIWADSGMKWDSTLCYADKEGFRCGVCYEYSVFNILNRIKLSLKERPLIVMDGSFQKYQSDLTATMMRSEIMNLLNQVKKYNGTFVFLWHNSSFNVSEWKKYESVYESIVKNEKKHTLNQ
jgi:hypothetical protein